MPKGNPGETMAVAYIIHQGNSYYYYDLSAYYEWVAIDD